MPVLFVLVRALLASWNVAYWDELDTSLAFLLRLNSSASWHEALDQLFAVNNEHRMFTSRLLFAVSYLITGTVNFVAIGIIGNLFLCALCAILVATAGSTERKVRMGVLLAFLLFQLEHYENFLWSGSSIDHFQVVLLAGAALVALSRSTRPALLAGCLLGLLANFTLAHGIVVWPVGALVLAHERRWPALATWTTVAILAIAAFLSGFVFNPGHHIGEASAAGLGRITLYWLALLGASPALGHEGLSPWLGVALLGLLGWAVARGAVKRERIALPLAIWAIASLALVALGRMNFTQGHVYSRYYVLGSLAWALVLFMLVPAQGNTARSRRAILCALSVLGLFNIAANAQFSSLTRTWIISRDSAADQYMRNGRDGAGVHTLHPNPDYASRLIREVETAGIYRMPRTCRLQELSNLQLNEAMRYYVDRISVNDRLVTVEGWAAFSGQSAERGQVHLVLQSANARFIYNTLPDQRPDVIAAHPEESWEDPGFRFRRRRWLIPEDNYQIGILIKSDRGNEYVMTAHRLDLTGQGRGILANRE